MHVYKSMPHIQPSESQRVMSLENATRANRHVQTILRLQLFLRHTYFMDFYVIATKSRTTRIFQNADHKNVEHKTEHPVCAFLTQLIIINRNEAVTSYCSHNDKISATGSPQTVVNQVE